MSERKSAEIKFRCTPSFKAETQVDAAAVGESLTVYVERAVQERKFRAAIHDDIAAVESEASAAQLRTEAEISAVVAASWEDDEPPVDDEGNAVACTCRPWEFCTHKAEA